MSHRGFDEADDMIKTLEKEASSHYITGSQYHNIGYNFERHIRSDLKETEDRFLMSYCFEGGTLVPSTRSQDPKDKSTIIPKKVYVIFGTNNKAFLEVLTDIILDSINKDTGFNVSFCLVLNKDFNVKYASRLDEMTLRVNLRRHMDSSLFKPPFHSLGARYSLMTEEEVSTLLHEAKLTKRQLKKISWNDPMIMYYDYPRGSVVRVHRTPNIAGSLMSGPLPPDYRLVL